MEEMPKLWCRAYWPLAIFLLVALAAWPTCWLASELYAAKVRRDLVHEAQANGPFNIRGDLVCGGMFSYDFFGNPTVVRISLPNDRFSQDDVARFQRSFPNVAVNYFSPSANAR
jgi:hypothetical protein